jgi:hypothetical protein
MSSDSGKKVLNPHEIDENVKSLKIFRFQADSEMEWRSRRGSGTEE